MFVRHKSHSTVSLFCVVGLILAACSPHTGNDTRPTTSHDNSSMKSDGIAWFDGTVDEAFAAAREHGKPIFLYWGAEWCPPCHAIKATVFRSREFIERSKLFIPVYLDGDEQDAQAAGERFAVFGYPTMIVFSANGAELTRIPGGIDIQAYANVLDLALASSGSIADLLERLLAGPRDLDAADCKRLTYYSWGQDQQILADRKPVDVYRRIHDACPADLLTERSIMFASYLDEMATADDDPAAALQPEQRAEAISAYRDIVNSPNLSRANVLTLIFSGSKIIAMLTEPGTPERVGLVEETRDALNDIGADESIYKRDRIYTALGKVKLERIDDEEAEISAGLKQDIVAMVEWADQSTPDAFERQDVINAASALLENAGMAERSKELLLAELDRSQQPYYFMVSLADIEQSAGNYAEALDWLRRAYEASRGPATRFQWGYYYVAGLVEMSPDDAELIRRTTLDVISELEGGAGFYQRPKAQLKKLESKLTEWNVDSTHAESLRQIRDDVMAICARFTDQAGADSTCRSFLNQA